VSLRCVDLARNMARFYSMEVERDLFGRVVLVRRWGRIGTAGNTRLDEHASEGRAPRGVGGSDYWKRQKGQLSLSC
jgi:predicted DNA-binding WGR domain protein